MYDLVVVGAGLHALTLLCALLEDDCMDLDLVDATNGVVRSRRNERAMRKKLLERMKQSEEQIWKGKNILVIDKYGTWLQNWRKQFEVLRIESLRSNAGLHPDPFDPEMLFEFARMRGFSTDEAFDEISEVRRGKDFVGPFLVPKTAIFNSFCEYLIDSYKLRNVVMAAEVVSIVPPSPKEDSNKEKKEFFQLVLQDGRHVESGTVVVAIGHSNLPNIPDWVDREICPPPILLHAWELAHVDLSQLSIQERVVAVIGGGLTAIQLAQMASAHLCSKIYLISRMPLRVRQFDSDLTWSGKMRLQKLRKFWNEPQMEKRVHMIKEARQGGTVTPSAKEAIDQMQQSGVCTLLEDVEVWDLQWNGHHCCLDLSNGDQIEVDLVWLATGSTLDVSRDQLFEEIMHQYPVQNFAGYPILDKALRWHPEMQLHFVGGYASLALGPDGVNLAGARRAAFRLKEHLEGIAISSKARVR